MASTVVDLSFMAFLWKIYCFLHKPDEAGFHQNDRNRIEVFDFSSDVVVYDLERDAVLTDSLLMKQTAFETFPAFSPDGKKLYFCSAEAKTLPYEFDQVKYSLCSIDFDAESEVSERRWIPYIMDV